MKCRRAAVLSVLPVALLLSSCRADVDTTPSLGLPQSPQKLTTDDASGQAGAPAATVAEAPGGASDPDLDLLIAALDHQIVAWSSEGLLQRPLNTGLELSDTFLIYDLAKSKRDGAFEFSALRNNGKTVYKNHSGETVKYDLSRGYWEFIGRETVTPAGSAAALSNERAEARTLELLRSIGLDEQEFGSIITTGVGTSSETQIPVGAATAIARHTGVSRQLGGVRVLDSRAAITYGLDGEPINLEIRWPDFAIASGCEILTREEAMERVARSLSRDAVDFEAASIRSQIVYDYDRAMRLHHPALHLKCSVQGDEVLVSLCR